ncbi:polysaccharide pyruvyl transferase family protein [Megamonas funiformis]|uniref:polysaccharide pyruvyl transferase family protein n=2 Tax=Megamonas funiformis TaxID=437897 RepID=UPI0022E04730|nr:polysaccharide pyruvyl transferase family protein [Megamonas funiformis]
MKIAIITLNGHFNYGNRLQNYALQEFLKNFSEQVDTIWYEKNEWWNNVSYLPETSLNKKFLSKKYLKYILKYILNRHNIRMKEKILKENYGEECIRQYNIKKFSDRYISIHYDYRIKENIGTEYDFFVVGSDQIWYPFPNKMNIRFLKFAPYEKRIAYAASLGNSKIEKVYKNLFKKSILGMKHISVRESKGAEIIYELIGKKVPVLVDPTLLLSKEKWDKMIIKPSWYKECKYIFVYFLGDLPLEIKKFAQKYNLKIINMMDKFNFDIYVSGVEEFIYLIKNAQLVVTDSFHGTIFSILMNIPFIVLSRKENNKLLDMNSRIETLLELFGYQDRYIVNGKCNLSEDEILHMDFSDVKAIQEREIERSTAYMKKALNLE